MTVPPRERERERGRERRPRTHDEEHERDVHTEGGFAREWQNLDEKVLLAQIVQQLGAIHAELQTLNRRTQPDTNHDDAGEAEMVVCDACGERVRERERVQHAQQVHGAPSNLTPADLPMF